MSERHRVNLSTAWEPPSEGSRTWVRRFGQPSGIEPGDHVWLVVEDGEPAMLVLNGVCLAGANGRHDVTELLEPRNELLLVPSMGESSLAAAEDDVPSPALSHGRRDLDPRHGRVCLKISGD